MNLTPEQDKAWTLFSSMSKEITELMTKFSSWLIAIQGSALALLLVNYSTVISVVDSSALKCVFNLYVLNFIIGVIVIWLSMRVKVSVSTAEIFRKMGDDFDKTSFLKQLSDGLIFPFRLQLSFTIWRKKNNNEHNPMDLIYAPAKSSQYQQLLVLLQATITVVMIIRLAISVVI